MISKGIVYPAATPSGPRHPGTEYTEQEGLEGWPGTPTLQEKDF